MLSLLLAFVTWLYIGEITTTSAEKTILQRLLLSAPYSTKQLFIKPIFVSQPPTGYEFLENDVKVEPEYLMVAGPSNVISEKEFIYTEPIDLSEHTKSKTLDIGLVSISRSIKFKKIKVQVYVPIEKTEAQTPRVSSKSE